MKLKLYLSLVSFGLCLLVFISLSFAWFTIQESNNSDGLDIGINSPDVDVDLYYYDGSSWQTSDSIIIQNMLVGDVQYFKIVLTAISNNSVTVGASLSNISSSISSELKYASGTKKVYVTDKENNDLTLYTANSDSLVKIGSNTLYDCSSGNIALSDYKIENAYKLYILESSTLSIASLTANDLSTKLFTGQVLNTINETYTCYFALEFNLASVTVNSVDLSEYYQYQKLTIGKIKIDL